MKALRDARVLVVGMGGLGCPAALVLARAGVGTLRLSDDDLVDESNLPRQILYGQASVGKPKLEEARAALRGLAPEVSVETAGRFVPDAVARLLDGCDLVVEGADNFPTKFLVADACRLARVPVVHAAAVRMHGTVFAVGRDGAPCYRCLFEDLLPGDALTCVDVGVWGPMLGVVAAWQADLALAMLEGRERGGTLVTYDAATDVLRRRRVTRRARCSLCGDAPRIDAIVEGRYISGMETTVRIPAPLRTLTGGKDEVVAIGANVGELIEDLEKRHPGMKDRLLDDKGVRRFVNIYVGEEDVRFLDGLKTELRTGDKVSIVPAIAGG